MLSFTRGTVFYGRLCLFPVHHPWSRRNATKEATGIAPPTARDAYLDLGTVEQSSRKRVAVWAVEAEVDPAALDSNTFTVEWPPNSGTEQRFPELDRAAYFDPATAREKIVEGQRPVLDRLRAEAADR